MLQALHGVILACGERMAEKHRSEILPTLQALESTSQETNRLEAAQCLGALCAHLPVPELGRVLKETVFVSEGVSDWAVLQARATALSAALKSAGGRIVELEMEKETREAVAEFATSDRVRGGEEERKEGKGREGRKGGKEGEELCIDKCSFFRSQVPVCVSGLQCVGSYINYVAGDTPQLIPALSEVSVPVD